MDNISHFAHLSGITGVCQHRPSTSEGTTICPTPRRSRFVQSISAGLGLLSSLLVPLQMHPQSSEQAGITDFTTLIYILRLEPAPSLIQRAGVPKHHIFYDVITNRSQGSLRTSHALLSASPRAAHHPPFLLSHHPAVAAPMAVEITASRAEGAISGSHRFTSHISKTPNPSGNPEHLKPLAVNGVLPPQIIQKKKINLILLLHPQFIHIERRDSQRLWRPLIAHYV